MVTFILTAVSFTGCEHDFLVTEDGESPAIGISPMIVVQEEISGIPVVIAATKTKDLMVSFKRTLDGRVLNFFPTPFQPPVAFVDETGTFWDVFGLAISGPNKGRRLELTNSMMGFWFSFATFYPGLTIYPSTDTGPNNKQSVQGSGSWSVPANEVRDGGPGIDGIPALKNPAFHDVKDDRVLDDDELVVGFFDGKNYKAYPHRILNWHEIVNENSGVSDFSIIYCPLTGTATAWSGILSNRNTTFGVSGLIYNSNIIPYDRLTSSYWSQIMGKSIKGVHRDTEPETFPVVETTWANWKQMYPKSKVMSDKTDYARDYDIYPYASYREDEFLIFPVKFSDRRLSNKERVHIIYVGQTARAYKLGLEKHK